MNEVRVKKLQKTPKKKKKILKNPKKIKKNHKKQKKIERLARGSSPRGAGWETLQHVVIVGHKDNPLFEAGFLTNLLLALLP